MMEPRSELLRAIASHDPAATALSDGNDSLVTYGELLEEVRAVAAGLTGREIPGLAILADNSTAQVVLDIACLEAGIWTLQCPPFFTKEQIEHSLQASGCLTLVTDQPQGNLSDTLEIAGQSLFMTSSAAQGPASRVIDKTAKVTFTSGSTGQPKGLCLSGEHLMAPVRALADVLSSLELQRHVTVLPQAVLLETIAGVYTTLYLGACCIVPSLRYSSGAPDIGAALHQLFDVHKAHTAILVPELLQLLTDECEAHATCPGSLRFLPVGGSRISDGLLQRAQRIGLPVFEGYGLSEAGSVVALNVPGAHKSGTVGRVLPHQHIRLADNGEIMLRQPGFLGYCGEAAIDTENSSSGFATGDCGFLDEDGYLNINGRLKNVLINSMGRNISPEWVESVLLDQPGIAQAVVFGDAQSSLSALVVPSVEAESSLQAAVSLANDSLPDYARVEHWQEVTAFTRDNGLLTRNGKLRRAAILDQYVPGTVGRN